MDAGEMNMKERISMMITEYSVLKGVLKENECGWSNAGIWSSCAFDQVTSITAFTKLMVCATQI
jgi:hypothetical protein